MIYGAGQAGRMVARWLPATCRLTAFIDNNPDLDGQVIDGIPVLPQEKALELKPDLIWLAILNTEARREIRSELSSCGYDGRYADLQEMSGIVEDAAALRQLIDLRLAAMRMLAQQIKDRVVAGTVAELGVYQGEFAAEINRVFPAREMILFDTFEGFDDRDLKVESEIACGGRNVNAFGKFSDTSVKLVLGKMPYPEQVFVTKGRFPESLAGGAVPASDSNDPISSEDLNDRHFALVSLDTDLYEPTLRGLEFFYPRLNAGGAILIHDYNSLQYPGVGRAVDEFCSQEGVYILPLADLHGTAVLIKQEQTS